MASTYSELQSEIINACMREGDTEFAALVPSFITFAEGLIINGNGSIDGLRVRDMETVTNLTATNGYVDLPSDFLEEIRIKGANNLKLENAGSDFLDRGYQQTGQSCYYTVEGSQLRVSPLSSETVALRYYASVPALSDAAPTNWLLTKHPGIYHAASMFFAHQGQEDQAKAMFFFQTYQQLIEGVLLTEFRSNHNNSVVRSSEPRP